MTDSDVDVDLTTVINPTTKSAKPSNESILKTDITMTVVDEKKSRGEEDRSSGKTTLGQGNLPRTGESNGLI